MKNVQNKLVLVLLIILVFPFLSNGQNGLDNELRYQVNRLRPYISVSREKIKTANAIIDVNPHYKSSWVREYVSVEILTSFQGSIRRAISKSDMFNQEQKDLMNLADLGKDIEVKVKYMPENTLKHNDIKEFDFRFIPEPENEATYAGGQKELIQYLKVNAMDKVSGVFDKSILAAVKFTISEEGQIIDAHLSESSKDEKIDELLLAAICNMPSWKPAEYASGLRVKQDFVLLVGNMESCTLNLINIR